MDELNRLVAEWRQQAAELAMEAERMPPDAVRTLPSYTASLMGRKTTLRECADQLNKALLRFTLPPDRITI